MTISPLKRRWMQEVAILNGKYVVRDGRADFDDTTGVGYIYTQTPIEGVAPFAVGSILLFDTVDGRSVSRDAKEYVYYGHIELTEIEVTN